MNAYILRGDTEHGPYSVSEVNRLCNAGKVLLTETVRLNDGRRMQVSELVRDLSQEGSKNIGGNFVLPEGREAQNTTIAVMAVLPKKKSGWANFFRFLGYLGVINGISVLFVYKSIFPVGMLVGMSIGVFLFQLAVFFFLAFVVDVLCDIRYQLSVIAAKT